MVHGQPAEHVERHGVELLGPRDQRGRQRVLRRSREASSSTSAPPGLTAGDVAPRVVSHPRRRAEPDERRVVDGKYVYMMEPLPFTNWTEHGRRLPQPVHERHVRVGQRARRGRAVLVRDARPSAASRADQRGRADRSGRYTPDYDPDMWEYDGTSARRPVRVVRLLPRARTCTASRTAAIYFAPRLMAENTNFPDVINAGQTVQVPVEWENLPEMPREAPPGAGGAVLGRDPRSATISTSRTPPARRT